MAVHLPCPTDTYVPPISRFNTVLFPAHISPVKFHHKAMSSIRCFVKKNTVRHHDLFNYFTYAFTNKTPESKKKTWTLKRIIANRKCHRTRLRDRLSKKVFFKVIALAEKNARPASREILHIERDTCIPDYKQTHLTEIFKYALFPGNQMTSWRLLSNTLILFFYSHRGI